MLFGDAKDGRGHSGDHQDGHWCATTKQPPFARRSLKVHTHTITQMHSQTHTHTHNHTHTRTHKHTHTHHHKNTHTEKRHIQSHKYSHTVCQATTSWILGKNFPPLLIAMWNPYLNYLFHSTDSFSLCELVETWKGEIEHLKRLAGSLSLWIVPIYILSIAKISAHFVL